LAVEIDRQAHRLGRQAEVLIQVNTGHESTKSGVEPEEIHNFFHTVAGYEGLVIKGLMCLPPLFEDAEASRAHFRGLREMLMQLRAGARNPESLSELSMGMSHDFEVAIEEGATLIRVGTALFGSRTRA
jgi:hypothetical protein